MTERKSEEIQTPPPHAQLIQMGMAGTWRKGRTEEEYATLLSKAGLRLTRVVPTESAVSVIEATHA